MHIFVELLAWHVQTLNAVFTDKLLGNQISSIRSVAQLLRRRDHLGWFAFVAAIMYDRNPDPVRNAIGSTFFVADAVSLLLRTKLDRLNHSYHASPQILLRPRANALIDLRNRRITAQQKHYLQVHP